MAGKTHTIGSMKLNYVASSADFTKGTKGVKGQIEKFVDATKKKFKSLKDSIKKSLSFKNITIGAAGLAAGFGAAMKSTADYSSTLVEGARVAGIGITEYEKLRLVLLGDGMAFNEAEAAMRRFGKRVGEGRLLEGGTFMKGMEEIAGKFPELTKDLVAKMSDRSTGPMQVLEALTNFATEAKLSAEETSSLFDLALGLQGRKMGITLVNATKEFGSLAKAQEHYGRFLTMTAEEHEKNKDLGQVITDTFENVKEAVRKIMSQAAEPLTKLMTKFNDWLLELKNDPDTFRNWIDQIQTILSAMKSFLEFVVKVGEEIKSIGESVSNWVDKWITKGDTNQVLDESQKADRPSGQGGHPSGYAGRGMAAPMGPGMASAGFGTGTWVPPEQLIYKNKEPDTKWPTNSPASPSAGVGAAALVGALEELRPTLQELNMSFREGIGDFVRGSETLKDALRNSANRILDGILQRTVIDEAAGWFSGGVNAFFGGLFGGGKKARGGRARGMTLVGEQGPEIVDFSSPAQVYNNNQLRSAMGAGGGGGSVSITYNIESTDGPGVRAALNRATPAIVQAATNNVAEMSTNVGAFRTMVQGSR